MMGRRQMQPIIFITLDPIIVFILSPASYHLNTRSATSGLHFLAAFLRTSLCLPCFVSVLITEWTFFIHTKRDLALQNAYFSLARF